MRCLLVIGLFWLGGNAFAADTFSEDVKRGPYLQVATPTSVIVRWMTASSNDTKVAYGTTEGALTQNVSNGTGTKDHEITVTGLSPDTKYFYSIGTTTGPLEYGTTFFFVTPPTTGTYKKSRIGVLGD